MKNLIRAAVIMLVAINLSACAVTGGQSRSAGEPEYAEFNDPWESFNRQVFAFNRAVDDGLAKPAAKAYRTAVPVWVRSRIGDALDNMRAPVIFLNDLLQGELDRALTTFVRFGINSTFGIGGLNDLAGDLGLEKHNEDFGQTLAVWGADEGPYVMLPVLGPSNPRDSIGLIVDFLVDPFNAWARNTDQTELVWTRRGTDAVHQRAELLDVTDDLEKTSLDLYAAVRSLYRQRRTLDINNGETSVGFGAPSAELPDWPSESSDEEVSKTP